MTSLRTKGLILYFAIAMPAATLGGCSMLEKAKPFARTMYDVAKAYCIAIVGEPGALEKIAESDPEVAGLSVEDICDKEKYLRPALDYVLAGADGMRESVGLTSGGSDGAKP